VRSRTRRRPATYDDTYAALTLREGREFWPADERYWNAVKHLRPWVCCIVVGTPGLGATP